MVAKCMSKTAAKVLLGVGAFVFVLSVAVLLIFPTIYRKKLREDIALGEGSLVTKIWEDIPLPLYEKLYFFNVTNGDDFMNKGVPLNVTEVGPYTFKGHWVKNYTHWNPNGTVTYTELRTYEFVEDMSVGSQDDVIITLNGPLIIAADLLKTWDLPFRIGASFLFKVFGETLITRKRVRELAYEGYKDEIIKWAPTIKKNIPYQTGVFSWLYGKNDSNDGLFTVFTGEDDPGRTNFIDRLNGMDRLDFWKGDACNSLNGTSIETGPPLPDTPDAYTFYQTIFCRSLTFDYAGDNTRQGIPTKRFEPDSSLFANGSENAANACFETKGERASGVLDVSPCQFDAPVFLSFPHFHLADPSYLRAINGLSPNGGEHGSYMEVEPITGLSVDIKVRFQINVEITHTKGVMQMDEVREGIYPVLWVALEISLDEHWANFLWGQLNNPKIIVYSVLGGLLLISVVMIVVAIVVLRSHDKVADDDDPLLNIKEEHKQNLKSRHLSTDYGTAASDSAPRDGQRKRSSSTTHGGFTNKGLEVEPDLRAVGPEDHSEDEAPILSVNSEKRNNF